MTMEERNELRQSEGQRASLTSTYWDCMMLLWEQIN